MSKDHTFSRLARSIDLGAYAFPAELSIKIGSQALTRVPPVGECSLVHQPPNSVARSVMDTRPTPEEPFSAATPLPSSVNLDAETVVRAADPDGNPLRAGVFRCVADGLLPDAVGRDLNGRRKNRRGHLRSRMQPSESFLRPFLRLVRHAAGGQTPGPRGRGLVGGVLPPDCGRR